MDEVHVAWKVFVPCACGPLRIVESLYTDETKRFDKAALKKRIKELCEMCVRSDYCAEDAFQTLERAYREACYSKTIMVENSSEFTSFGLDLWSNQKQVILAFPPRKVGKQRLYQRL